MKHAIPTCLLYCDALGHMWHVTALDEKGNERPYAHVNTGPDAYRVWSEDTAGSLKVRVGHIYHKVGKAWKLVSPSRASIS